MSEVPQNNKKIIIAPGCMGCGVCMASSSYFGESRDGMAVVQGAGIISGNDILQVQKIAENCPAHVIGLQDVEAKSMNEVLHTIQESLDNYRFPVPPKENFEFNSKNITVPIPFSTRERIYEYSSYEKAKRTGLDEFNRLMYSQRLSIIQGLMIEYKTNVLLPYYRYEKTSNNYYYKIEQELKALIDKVIAEVKLVNPQISLPDDFNKVTITINRKKDNSAYYFEECFEVGQANRALGEISNSNYSLSSYDCYFDVDDTEEYAGSGFFGDKYKTKYCFYNLKEAFESLANDIVGACRDVTSDITRDAYGILGQLWKNVEREIKTQLSKKADMLRSELKK